MFEKFEKELLRLGCKAGDSFLIALSGGCDSTVLLELMAACREKYDFRLEALHFNHQIRETEAKRDEDFSKALCLKLQIPFHAERANVPLLAKNQGLSTEECGRMLRYRALEEKRKERTLKYILTAHNKDDAEETLLLRLAKGAPLSGMCGIPEKRGVILRPLLSFTKKEIYKYAEKQQYAYVEDSSNQDCAYERNFIRHHLLENFRKVGKNATRTARLLKEDEDFLSSLVPQNSNLSLKELQALPLPLLRRWLIFRFDLFLEEENIPYRPLENKHMEALFLLIQKGVYGKSCSLPSLVKATVTKDGLLFSKDKTEQRWAPILLTEGENRICSGKYSFYLTKKEWFSEFSENKRKIHKTVIKEREGSVTMGEGLFISPKNKGDTIYLQKMHKSVSKLFGQLKIPLVERDTFPILYDEEGVLWVPGFPVREDRRANEETKQKFYIEFWENESV